MELDLTKVCDVEIEGIDLSDAPDFCDAYISKASIEITLQEYNLAQGLNQVAFNGKFFRDLTDTELDWLNDQDDYRFAQVEKWLY
jgi:hypothetical protein